MISSLLLHWFERKKASTATIHFGKLSSVFSLFKHDTAKKEELATEGQGKAETLNETTTKERGQPYIEISYERISFIFYHLYFCC